MREQKKPLPDSAQDDFPILLESELEPDANYCIECGKVHRPGECNNAGE